MCVCACIYGVCQCAQCAHVLETRKWLWDMVQTLCCLHLSIASDLMPRALCELTHGLLGNFLPQLLSCHRRTETTHVHQHVSFLHGLKGSNTYCRLLLQLLLLIEPSARSFHNRKEAEMWKEGEKEETARGSTTINAKSRSKRKTGRMCSLLLRRQTKWLWVSHGVGKKLVFTDQKVQCHSETTRWQKHSFSIIRTQVEKTQIG